MQHQEEGACQVDLEENDSFSRSVLKLLNECNPGNFDISLSRLKQLNIDNEVKMCILADFIFEKAISSNTLPYVALYAKLCKHLALIKVPLDDHSGEHINFRKVLITKCQKEFEERNESKDKKETAAAEYDMKKEKNLESEKKTKLSRKLGNVQFIAELFKLNMLIEPILNEYIKKLITQGDEESLECVCSVLKTVGKELKKNQVDIYSTQLQNIVDKQLTSRRLTLILENVIHLLKAQIHRLTEINSVVPPMIPPQQRTYGDPFAPNYARGAARMNQHFLQTKPKIIKFKTPLDRPIKLHESENAWKPLYKTKHDIEEKEKLKRNVQAVLNKLTFQKFKILLGQLKNLNITTEDDLNLVVDLIYENAILEPHFCVVYANLCKHLSQSQNLFNKPTEEFCTCLLAKCQLEFEETWQKRNQESELNYEENLKIQCVEGKKRVKARSIGNIRFIGELCNVKMIPCPILEECIEILLTCEDEESLECVFWLMKITGKQLESLSDSKRALVHEYITQIQEIVEKPSTSSRIRCLLKDIIDLKENKWIPRRNENVPRTIDEIHKEAALEAQKQMKIFQTMLSNVKNISHQVETNSDTTFECHHESKVPSRNNQVLSSEVDGDESDSEIADEVKRILLGQRLQTSKDDKEKKPTFMPEKDVTNK